MKVEEAIEKLEFYIKYLTRAGLRIYPGKDQIVLDLISDIKELEKKIGLLAAANSHNVRERDAYRATAHKQAERIAELKADMGESEDGHPPTWKELNDAVVEKVARIAELEAENERLEKLHRAGTEIQNDYITELEAIVDNLPVSGPLDLEEYHKEKENA